MEEQLRSFIEKFEPKHQGTIRAVRKALRKRFPTANELAYDNYNFFVIGYGPTERPSDCFLSIAAAANGVGLCFIHGASLPDPAKILSAQESKLDLFVYHQQRCFCSQKFRRSSLPRLNERASRYHTADAAG